MNTKPCLIAAGLCLLAGSVAASGPSAVNPAGTVSSPMPQQAQPAPPGPQANPPSFPSQTNPPPLTNREYQDLRAGVTAPPLAERRALYTQNLGHGLQLQAIGAPLPPIYGETKGSRDQVRVPVLSLAW